MTETSRKISWEIVKKTFVPLVASLLFLLGYVFYKIEVAPQLSPQLQNSLQRYILTVVILWAAFTGQRVIIAILAWYKANVAAKTEIKLDEQLIPLFSRSLKIIIWIVALLVILPFYGVNISALVTALGVGSLAIALAAQDTIANIIAGFLIMVDAPFKIGDKIKLPSGEMVKVLDIGVRRSKFLSEDNAIIIVPNVDLSKNKITNYTYGGK